jgi:hypothetical protein
VKGKEKMEVMKSEVAIVVGGGQLSVRLRPYTCA